MCNVDMSVFSTTSKSISEKLNSISNSRPSVIITDIAFAKDYLDVIFSRLLRLNLGC